MTISKTTHDRRASRWNEIKDIWGAKLDAADNDNDKAVAKAMMVQAEEAIKRLGLTDEVVPEVLEPITVPSKSDVKKTKHVKATTDILKAKGSTDTTSTIGL